MLTTTLTTTVFSAWMASFLKNPRQHSGRLLLHRQRDVAIQIERYAHLAMAQQGRCDLRVGIFTEQKCSSRAPQIMEPHSGQPGLVAALVPSWWAASRPGTERLPLTPCALSSAGSQEGKNPAGHRAWRG